MVGAMTRRRRRMVAVVVGETDEPLFHADLPHDLGEDSIRGIVTALAHCPRGIAAIGRVLAHGGQARAVVGPSDDQDATRHLEHARDHLLSALAYPDAVTDPGTDTGELESAHAGARCALAVELVERGRR